MEVVVSPSRADDCTKKFSLDDFISPSPMKNKTVPNHLTDTKIFRSNVKKDSLIKVDPTIVHFAGYNLRQTLQRKIKICNSSSERQNLHIISPATKYFSVKYTKPRRFVPGFTMDVMIQFTPDEWRYYYDCIRLHCEGEDNIIIPLHAYPVMDLSGYPDKMIFDTASSKLGKTRQKVLSLKSPHPVDFEYQITMLQSHPSFTVRPLSGTVPGEGEALVSVIYNPTEYVTSHMTMQLKISEFNSQPHICSVMASCIPNPSKKSIKESDEMYKKTKLFDPHSLSLVQMSRKRRTLTSSTPLPDDIEYHGYQFPAKLHTQHAANTVLMQKAGKLRAKDMREVVSSKPISKDVQESNIILAQMSTRQMKEVAFKQDLNKNEIEERANHLRWQVRTGSKVPTEEELLEILRERQRSQADYKYRRRCEPDEEAEILRYITFKAMRRTFRSADQLPKNVPSFDLYNDNPWLSRHRALERFQQAARTTLIRKRADKKVKMLRQMIANFNSDNVTQQVSSEAASDLQLDVRHPATPGNRSHNPELVFLITPAKVKPFTFPVFVPSDDKDALATDKLDEFESSGSSIMIRTKVPYHHLKVPKQYDMLGYKSSDVDRASRSYVPPSIAQPLRSGAEDELIHVTIPPHLQIKIGNIVSEENESLCSDSTSKKSDQVKIEKSPTTSDVVMPHGLLSNPPRHSLQIFNPFPGIQRTYLPLPQSEVDPDFHLCPIPRSSVVSRNRPYFDKRDTIKEVMHWKSFPPQALASLSQGGSVNDVILPRWSDPFSEAMVPMLSPVLLRSSTQSDAEPLPEFATIDNVELLPTMIQQEFKVSEEEISAAALAEEEDREQKAAEAIKPVKSSHDQLTVRLESTLKKLENMDKRKHRLVYC